MNIYDIMKKLGIFAAIAVLATALVSSCSKPVKESADTDYASVEGEWHMVSWSGEMSENIDLYVKFDADHTFVLYQKLKFPYFVRFTGSYSIVDKVLTGIYDDDTPTNTYDVAFDGDDTRLTLSNRENPDDITIFVREPIPSAVVDGTRSLTAHGEEVYNVSKFF